MIFGIKKFYPSIKEKWSINALEFAEAYTFIYNEYKRIIKHPRKYLLFNNQQTWIEKESELFDITIGARNGAELFELFGSFLLYQIWKKFNKKNDDLYQNDGLAVFKNGRGARTERTKKYFQKFFHENDLSIVTKYNLKIIDCLSVTLNLLNNTYKPFSKSNNEINYIYKESNHLRRL